MTNDEKELLKAREEGSSVKKSAKTLQKLN